MDTGTVTNIAMITATTCTQTSNLDYFKIIVFIAYICVSHLISHHYEAN